ncbi:hypothetical protein F7C95_16030 [Opitutia bacterium ISCC 51]|nr:hypothetical protein F7C95_16030 [Opitutae bacterium ISCC 51]QXD27491.1 hypothetical protein GA003_15930 [Opitutae bacterium ISCC 52]
MIEPCPYLPDADPSMDWRSMQESKSVSNAQFYRTALGYGQVLWLKNLPARALLAIDRALLTSLTGKEPEIQDWPLPYRAMAWMLAHYDDAAFVGNPRVHFQHLATRVRGDRHEQRKWRAWACCYLACLQRPLLPGDEKQGIEEPTRTDIEAGLEQYGIERELETWLEVVEAIEAANLA